MMLHLILPSKETFTDANAGAIARVAADSLHGSQFRDDAMVFGQNISTPPMGGVSYLGLTSWHRFFHGSNIGLGKAYINWLRKTPKARWPYLIEVHGRCALARMIASAVPEVPVVLFQHNDPRTMTGARSGAERTALTRVLAGVFSNSGYIESCFREGLPPEHDADCQFHIIRLGARRWHEAAPKKSHTILFVGRMVPEKGAAEAAEAIASVLPDYPEWRFVMIGARRFEEAVENDYAARIRSRLKPLGDQVELTGFVPAETVRRYQDEAAIVLAPSQWQEPAGLVVLEALASGSALITSRRGGIPEYTDGRSVLLDEPDGPSISDALRSLLSNPAQLKSLQDKAWKDYPFTLEAMVAAIDEARSSVITRG